MKSKQISHSVKYFHVKFKLMGDPNHKFLGVYSAKNISELLTYLAESYTPEQNISSLTIDTHDVEIQVINDTINDTRKTV